MIKYLARFLPDLSERSYHLRVLMKADVHFQFGPEQQRTFEDMTLKALSRVSQFCSFMIPKCQRKYHERGLGAVLQQLH